MANISIIGDGPGGLSAALFLARSEHSVTVYGIDATVMNYAFLNNYLGVEAISGTDFQIAARNQVEQAGASFRGEEVTAVSV
ncbi:MAG: FAD-dependent oxidoreductase, partial [Acidimicrobiales bacterium]|nr:FAD-dependent oxidoreductase [Acidimicrobiales bacterium]